MRNCEAGCSHIFTISDTATGVSFPSLRKSSVEVNPSAGRPSPGSVDVGLIEWTPYLPGHVIGSARIRGPGVDAVEHGSSASLEIRFPKKPAPVVFQLEKENGATSTDKSPIGTGVLSSWQGSLSSVEQTGSLEPLASREDARSAPSHMVETFGEQVPLAVGEAFGENAKSPLSAPSANSPPQREILTLKPTLWGMSIDLKELALRASAWWRARQ